MAILKGKAKWAFITIPNTTYAPVYTINLVVDDQTAKIFKEKGYFIKQEPEGPAIVIQRKVDGPHGRVRPAPKLYDKDNKEIKDLIGNGSYVAVQYNEYSGQSEHGPYQGLDLQAVKVLKHLTHTNEEEKKADGSELFEVDE
jgi:hypothetical protein